MVETSLVPSAQPVSTLALCLAAIRDLGAATVTDVGAATGLSRPTVEAALGRMASAGLVQHADQLVQPRQRGGRPARLSRFSAHRGLVAGVDLLGSSVEVLIADLAGREVAASSGRHPSPRSDAADPGLVATAVRATLADAGLDQGLLRAVGVGTAGLVADGVTLTSPVVLPWQGRNIRDELQSAFGVPVTLDNDLNLAALAESTLGALKSVGVGVYVQTWHHVSARIVVDGAVLRGRRGSAGEVGVLRSFAGIDVPPGPFDVAVAEVDAELERLLSDPADTTGAQALDRITTAMTPAITALALAVDPDVIVLGGALDRHAGLIAPVLTTLVNDFADGGIVLDVVIEPSRLRQRAVAVGAAVQAFEVFSEEVYGTAGVNPPMLRLRPGRGAAAAAPGAR